VGGTPEKGRERTEQRGLLRKSLKKNRINILDAKGEVWKGADIRLTEKRTRGESEPSPILSLIETDNPPQGRPSVWSRGRGVCKIRWNIDAAQERGGGSWQTRGAGWPEQCELLPLTWGDLQGNKKRKMARTDACLNSMRAVTKETRVGRRGKLCNPGGTSESLQRGKGKEGVQEDRMGHC